MSLLADRFQLKAHRETKEAPIYGLMADSRGHKLRTVAGVRPYFTSASRGYVSGTMDITTLANWLAWRLERPVVDKTGLSGTYDVELIWTPDVGQAVGSALPSPAPPPPPPAPPGPGDMPLLAMRRPPAPDPSGPSPSPRYKNNSGYGWNHNGHPSKSWSLTVWRGPRRTKRAERGRSQWQYTTGAGVAGGGLLTGVKGSFLKEWMVYAAPSTGQWGSAGRNSMRGPAQFGLNAGIARTFPLGERLNLDWRVGPPTC